MDGDLTSGAAPAVAMGEPSVTAFAADTAAVAIAPIRSGTG